MPPPNPDDTSLTSHDDRLARLAIEPLRDMNPPTGFFRGAVTSWANVWRRHELLYQLVRREIRGRYKDSILGIAWSLVRPLVQLLIYYIVVGKFLGAAGRPGQGGIPNFAIFVFSGLTLWNLFSEIVSTGTVSIVGNSGLVKKVQLPREVFPLAAVGSALFNFLIQCAILVAAVLITSGFNTDVTPLLLFGGLFSVIVWATAVALILSACNVYLRDTQYLVEVGLLVGFWASPIVYSFQMVSSKLINFPILREVYLLNPVTLAIMGFQRVSWQSGDYAAYPDHLAYRILGSFFTGVVVLFLAQRIFSHLQRNFAQEM